jgi:hypothetical protein
MRWMAVNFNTIWSKSYVPEMPIFSQVQYEEPRCRLCQETLEPSLKMLGAHIGRHMEEISFCRCDKTLRRLGILR